MCSLLHKVSHDINAFNQLRTMAMGQLLGSRVACNMHRFLVKLWLSIKKFSYLLPVQYNITFSVRFFCPRAISKLGDKTHLPGHIFFIIIFVLDIPAVSILEYPNKVKFSIWDEFKRCKKLEINLHYLNPIPIFKDFISHSQRPNPSPSNHNPIFPA